MRDKRKRSARVGKGNVGVDEKRSGKGGRSLRSCLAMPSAVYTIVQQLYSFATSTTLENSTAESQEHDGLSMLSKMQKDMQHIFISVLDSELSSETVEFGEQG